MVGTITGGSAATATPVRVGGLSFAVPDGFQPGTSELSLGQGWTYSAVRAGAGVERPSAVVLARADLSSVVPEEIISALFASSINGLLPSLQIGRSRTRSMVGGGEQRRLEVQYAVSRGAPFHGTVMVLTRSLPAAGLLVVLGDDTLTAGTIDGVLDSARWLR